MFPDRRIGTRQRERETVFVFKKRIRITKKLFYVHHFVCFVCICVCFFYHYENKVWNVSKKKGKKTFEKTIERKNGKIKI